MKMSSLKKYVIAVGGVAITILCCLIIAYVPKQYKILLEDDFTGTVYILFGDNSDLFSQRHITIYVDSLGLAKLNNYPLGGMTRRKMCFAYRSKPDICLDIVYSKKEYINKKKKKRNLVIAPTPYIGSSFRLSTGEYVEFQNGYIQTFIGPESPNRDLYPDLEKIVKKIGIANFRAIPTQ
jgi:hypothetical protein